MEIIGLSMGALFPTPHRAKMAAMHKGPFPLPDMEVERMEVVKRLGVRPPVAETYTELTFTAEDINNVVCNTGRIQA